MGIENLRHVQKRLDAEKKRSQKRDELKKAAGFLHTAVLAAGIGFGGAGAISVWQQDKAHTAHNDTPPVLLKLAAEKNKLPVEQFTSKEKELPDRLVFNVALLAHNAEPRYAAFENDPALAHAVEIDKRLVLPLVTHRKVDAEFWRNLSEEFRSYEDPTAEIKLDLLKHVSEQFGGVEPIELEESVAYVARNLYMKGEQPTAAHVQSEVQSILESRKELAGESLFDQDTLLVSGDELWKKGSGEEPRFGNQAFQAALEERLHMSGNATARFSHVTPLYQDASGFHSTPESIEQAKIRALEEIALSRGPLTVYFDGHGGDGYFWFSGSVSDTKHETISFYELANVLAQKWTLERKQNPDSKGLDVSLIFDDCMMQSFVRDLSETLASMNVPLPRVMITASEWEQYGFDVKHDPLGSGLKELVVKSPNLGTIIEHKHDVHDEDPSIFAPRPDDATKLMQVSGIVVASDVA